jgi:hypothetical protein
MLDTLSRRALIVAAALAFAGCAGSSGTLAPTSGTSGNAAAGMRLVRGSAVEGFYRVPLVAHPWKLPHVWPNGKKQILFVADPQNNQVLMYDPKTPNPSSEGSITTGIDYPFGVAVDKKGNLYVANLLGGSPDIGSVTVYPKGSTSPSLTITNGMSNPYGIGVDSKGNVFCAMLGNNTMVGYKAGQTSPFETVSFPAGSQVLGLGIDKEDNAWLGSDTNNSVYEVPAGTTTPQNANLSGLNGTINVAFGKKDVMYVSNFGGSNVTVYAYGTTSPEMTITTGIEKNGPTLGGFSTSGYYFQSNQNSNVAGYKKGANSPFSSITGIPDPRGDAGSPEIKK